MSRILKGFALFASAVVFISCAPKYACKDKVEDLGVQCETIQTVYEEKMIGIKPEKAKEKRAKKKEEKVSEPALTEAAQVVKKLAYDEDKPVRLPPRVIRIWIAPWEDSDGDLHQSSFIYSEISPKRGRWLFGEKEMTTTQPLLRPVEKLEKPKEEREPKEEKKEKEKTPPKKETPLKSRKENP